MAKYTEFYQDLSVLGFSTDQHDSANWKQPNLKVVNSHFRKMAFKLHPDKPTGDTESMKTLSEAFFRLSNYIRETTVIQDEGDEAENSRLKEFFNKFNDIQNNINSTTIFLENKYSSEWESILCASYGSPILSKTGKILP